jgi:hypothetical protein
MRAVDPLFDPPMRLDRALLDEWATWDTRFGILPKRPNTSKLFDTTLAPSR